ncbi:MarR family winged helix-turn-helix transcriptional regulator [Actinacidiphila sp. DG2A-62]|jgi:DNA-binding MarR family transcriptional regulator|uniref:MarR family winged helix-turn-helix transcriptional regulator n=1 Tax=Actinacidiphila sp. DG2A-62 TaxID=3108821 RepID=UPI002DBEB5CB|nr:MarR family winged helix-turn-helix transcriptional regulator [Actinacidiphila sp. DG2A-62]MEC3998501.1 MarR family winged helix-turn-helix transcriptional regulator [Actinacidiphila sp. DG2A-62]
MHSPTSTTRTAPERTPSGAAATGPTVDSEITWLLHRAAQRLRGATSEQAEKYGLQLRDYIVLSALDRTPNLTQGELARTLGLDKTTLMSQLDRLEGKGLVVRRTDPRDRRARIPEITAAGGDLRAAVAAACDEAEQAALGGFPRDQVQLLRRMLFGIIGDSEDRGSCL